MVRRVVLSAMLSSFFGLAWALPWPLAGPALSILLITLVLSQSWQTARSSRSSRYFVALAYYLAGSHGIPLASAVFFGPGAGSTATDSGRWRWCSCSMPWSRPCRFSTGCRP